MTLHFTALLLVRRMIEGQKAALRRTTYFFLREGNFIIKVHNMVRMNELDQTAINQVSNEWVYVAKPGISSGAN